MSAPDKMTATELRAWIEKRGMGQPQAAHLLGLCLRSLVYQVSGQRSVTRQTAIICGLLDELEAESTRLDEVQAEIERSGRPRCDHYGGAYPGAS